MHNCKLCVDMYAGHQMIISAEFYEPVFAVYQLSTYLRDMHLYMLLLAYCEIELVKCYGAPIHENLPP